MEYNGMETATIIKRIPTKADVDLLIREIGVPEEGSEVRKDDIAKLLRISTKSQRFGTVIACWKGRLFDAHNVVMVPTFKGSWVAAAPEDKITEAVRLRKQAVGRLTKAVTVAASADTKRLSSESRIIQDGMRRQITSAKLMLAEQIKE